MATTQELDDIAVNIDNHLAFFRDFGITSLRGLCGTNNLVAWDANGKSYSTEQPSDHGLYGHTIATIPLSDGTVQIVDITNSNPFISVCENNPEAILHALSDNFGVDGWHPNK
jgi:hypothetical protein